MDSLFEKFLHTVTLDTITPFCHQAWVDGRLMCESRLPTKILPVGIFLPTFDQNLIAKIESEFKILLTHHQPGWLGGATIVRAIKPTELNVEPAPVYLICQFAKRMGQIDYLFDGGGENINLARFRFGFQ